MPSMHWLGASWHLSSDALALAGAALLLVNSVWLAVYVSILLALSRPVPCHRSGRTAVEHHIVVWGLLAFLGLNAAMAAAMVWVGTRGAPLQPSKRRRMATLLHIQLVKWVLGSGFLGFALWAVHTLPPSCWDSGRRGAIEALLWCTIGVCVLLGYNALACKDPAERWEVRLRWLGRLLGCYSLLTQPPQDAAEDSSDHGRSEDERAPPLKELSIFMARSFGKIDVEKTDVLAGLYLTTAMVGQQRRATAMARLQAAGVVQAPRVQAEAFDWHEVTRQWSSWADRQVHSSSSRSASFKAAVTGSAGSSVEQESVGPGRTGAGDGKPQHAVDVSIPVDDSEDAFWGWLHGICRPPECVLEPPASAALLAPDLSPQQLAALCCECAGSPVPRHVLAEAEHWVWHAVAAYGQQDMVEHARHRWLARLRLLAAAYPRSRPAQRAPAPVKDKLLESKQYAQHYIGGKMLLGYNDADIVYLSFSDSFLGAVPYGIVLDRKRRTVVVTVRGTSSMASLLSDLSERPEELSDWLPPVFKQAHAPRLDSVQGHRGILSAAKGVLADLNRHRIVQTLLTGEPYTEEGPPKRAGEAAHGGQGHEAAQRTPQDYQALLRQRGLDCRGWRLVLTGHSLGAGIAALLAPHFADWWPDVHAWAFCPPGGMVTANLAAALEPLVTCVIVGKDSVSRTSSATFERLQDQVVVALARCRVSKLRVLLRGRSPAFRHLPESKLFFPPHRIPGEALSYLRRYFEAKQRYKDQLVHMEPPGRCALLRRLKGGGGPQRGRSRCYQAVWVDRATLMQEGILLSRHQVKDHYTSRLTASLASVLGSAGGGS